MLFFFLVTASNIPFDATDIAPFLLEQKGDAMNKNQFDFSQLYSAQEIAEIFELPIFVERAGWQDTDFKYRIIEVADVLKGEGWSRGKQFDYKKVYTKNDKFLVCRNQPLKYRAESSTALFPVVVMATMSSGKSTLINALLNKSILPSSNSACTAKSYRIYDNDTDDVTEIEPVYRDGQKAQVSYDDWATVLKKANENPNIDKIIIRTQIKGVLNTKKRAVLIDTPGTNNSQDASHGKITLDILSKIKEGLIVYIINATQFGINDDKTLLLNVCQTLNKRKELSAVFVVNKCDEYEAEKGESIEKILMDIHDYLTSECKIENPDIIPTSALWAEIFKKVLRHEGLTRTERRKFNQYFTLYPPQRASLSAYAITKGCQNPCEYIEVSGEAYRVADIIEALNNTGIPYLERYIQNAQIVSEHFDARR